MAIKKQLTDADFIIGLKSDNDLALSTLYKKFYPQVLKYIINNNGSEQEAKDIYQETVLVLYNNVKKTDFELNCSLQTYIYAIAKRLWLKQIHKNSLLYRLTDSADEDGTLTDFNVEVDQHLEKEQQFLQMQNSLMELGEPCKTLIEDFYINRFSMDEIADKFGYTNSDNAKNQKYKCLQRLKRLYFNYK